jgi:hypothetical protein
MTLVRAVLVALMKLVTEEKREEEVNAAPTRDEVDPIFDVVLRGGGRGEEGVTEEEEEAA